MTDIQRVAISDIQPNGTSVSSTGRVFASFPRWFHEPTPGVCEATAEQTFRPFPGGKWNDWKPGEPPQERLICVHGTFVDHHDNLWIVDDAAPFHGALVPGGPKLVKVNLATNRVDRVYPFDESLAPPGTVISHFRRDEDFGYVTDGESGALVVLDLATGRGRRILAWHPKMAAHNKAPAVNGVPMTHMDGRPLIINVNLLELSLDKTWLYFIALFGPWLKRVKTEYLRDPRLSDDEIATHIEDVAEIPPCTGIALDKKSGNLFFSSFTLDAVGTLDQNGKYKVAVADPRICGPNEAQIGPDGYIYMPATQATRGARFQKDGVSRIVPPYEVLKIKLPA